jgi:hypothetical protein
MTNQTGFPSNINGDLKSAALTYAAEGLKVIPLHFMQNGFCSCGKTDCKSPAKHPIGSLVPRGLTDASTNPQRITAWWAKIPQANIGICTGPLVVIDADARHNGLGSLSGLNLPLTLTIETGNGLHLWFRSNHKIKNSAGKLGAGIDVRGEGGYVVAPPSVHFSGKVYKFSNYEPIVEYPSTLIPQPVLQPTPLQPKPSVPDQKPDDIILTDADILGQSAPSGGRNSFLTSFAGKLRSFGLGETEIESSLLAINQQRCKPPLADSEVRRIAKSVGRYSPSAAAQIDQQVADHPQPQAQAQAAQGSPPGQPKAPANTLSGVMKLEQLLLTIYGEQEPILNALYKGDWGIVAALPNLGKSTFMLNLSIALAAGRPFLPFTPEKVKPRKVLYLDYEASEFRLQKQLYKMLDWFMPHERELCGENLHFVLHPQVNNLPLLLTERGSMKALNDYIKQHSIDLVIIDTLAQATWLNDENNNSEVQRKVVMPMSQLAFHTNTAVLLIHHEGKGSEHEGENFLQFRTRGASALVAGARYQITMMPTDKKSRKNVEFHCSKDKGEKFEPVTMTINPESRWFEIVEPEVAPPKMSIEDVIVETLEAHTHELSLGDLESLILGTPKKTIKNKLTELVRSKRVIRTKHGCYRSAWTGDDGSSAEPLIGTSAA